MPISSSVLSPLRYPGSKASLINYITEVLKDNYLEGCHFLEPYAGSAIISLELLRQGLVSKATIIERDPLIFAFWHSVFFQPQTLIEKIYYLPITIDTWHEFQKYRTTDNQNDIPIVDLGLAGLFFNRTNYSGILKAGPIGGQKQDSQYKIDCRFNKERIIRQIESISQLNKKVSVHYDDALSFLQRERQNIKTEECFLYIDPPYYKKGKSLYRYWYNDEDHRQLATFLKRCDTPWLVSYDNHEYIRKTYKNSNLVEIYFDYTVSGYRKECEILISNLKIPPSSLQKFKDELA